MNENTEPMDQVSALFGTMLGASVIAVCSWILYPRLKTSLFPSLPEAEVQTYLLGLLIFLIWIALRPLWIPYLHRVFRTFRITVFDRRALASYGLICSIVCTSLFVESVTRTDVQMQLGQMGIQHPQYAPFQLTVSFLVIFVMCVVLMTPKPKSTRLRMPLFIFTISLLVPLTFYVGKLAYYDATHFVGPIHDLVLGVAPLSSPSWYGFLPVGIFAVIFRVIPLSLVNIYIAIALIETLGYVLLYIFVLKLWGDDRRAVITTCIAVLFHFLVQSVDRNYYLQSTFIRFGIWMPVAFALIAAAKQSATYFFRNPWLIFTVALAFFWTTDIGMYVTCAFIGMVILVTPAHDILSKVISSLRALWPVMVGLLSSFIIVSSLLIVVYGALPNWANYWQFAWNYRTVSMFALPMKFSIFPIFFLCIPLISIGLLIGKHSRSYSYRGEELVIMFLALLSLFQFTYYTGDSHLNSLHTINTPAIICFMWILKEMLSVAARQDTVTRVLIVSSAALLGMTPLTLWSNQAIQNLKSGNIVSTLRTIQSPDITEYDIVGRTALGVKQAYAQTLVTGDFAIISPWDTWYLLIWGTTNKLGSNCLLCYWTPEMASTLISSATQLQSTYLFVDRDRNGYEGRVSWIFTDNVARRYSLIDRIGDLDIYKRIY